MATKNQFLPSEQPLSLKERAYWRDLYKVSLEALIIKHDGKRMAPEGTGQLAAHHADVGIREDRRRFRS